MKYTLDPSKRFTPRVNSSRAESSPVFSAREIACTVGMSRHGVRAALAAVQPTAPVVRSGNVTPGYPFEMLPEPIKAKIEQQQLNLNYRSPQAVLAAPKKQWNPARPLSEQTPAAMEYAHCLQRALAFYIAHRNDLAFRAGELLDRAAMDWQEAFKKPATRRHVRRAIDRVLERDNGREEFSRLEIYLPESNESERRAERTAGEFPALAEVVKVLPDVSVLSYAERATIWKAALDDLEFFIGGGLGEKKAKRNILNFLTMRVPRLAETPEAARRQLDRKLDAFQAEGIRGLCDKRRERPRKIVPYTGPESLTSDERLLLGRAVKVGGGLSQAYRDLYLGFQFAGRWMQFSDEFRAVYKFSPRKAKSRVPRGLRVKLQSLIEATKPLSHGPRAAMLAGPRNTIDWSNILAGDFYTADDMTPNELVWHENPSGKFVYQGRRFDVFRPQILTCCDCRTDYIFGSVIVLFSQYNSLDIQRLLDGVCSDPVVGMPFRGFLLEGGSWQSNKVKKTASEWTKLHDALARSFDGMTLDTLEASPLGMELKRARNPRAKNIERIWNIIQNSMQAMPGFVGRNERMDCYERAQKALRLMRRFDQPGNPEAEEAPWNHFLSVPQYREVWDQTCHRFNHEIQNGKRLPGISPAEGWKTLSGGRPHRVAPESLRFIWATEESVKKFESWGIDITICGEKRSNFESHKLATLVGQKVIARSSQANPDHIICVHPASDPLSLNPFVVRSPKPLPALEATAEQHAESRRSRNIFLGPQRSIFSMLQHDYGRTVRDELLGNPQLRMAGEAHNQVERAEVEAKPTREAAARKARKNAISAGMDPNKIKRAERAGELESFDALRARLRQREAEESL